MKPATLYAYVSRGLILRHVAADGRTSLFDPADLAKLERRPRRRGSPTEIVVASELTLVDTEAGRLFYRGLDAVELSRTRRFEEIAGFLWTGNFDGTGPWTTRTALTLADDAAPFERLRLAAVTRERFSSPIAAATDLMSSLVDALPGGSSRGTFGQRLWTKLGATRGSVRLLDTALSLTADHGLTYSSLIARVAAAGGADVASCVTAAMSAGAASIASSHFGAIESSFASGAIDDELLATDPYRGGDPRGASMLALLQDELPDDADVVRGLVGERPSAVVAQAAIAWACGMQPGASEIISLVSRVAGWIAHVLEEYRRPTPFRPRLAYTGPAPRAAPIRMLDAVQGYLARE